MASVPATIVVTVNSNYAGMHRICYTINGSGGYTCVTVNCPGGGATCTVDIPITVDNESCTPITFSGYEQPGCEDISSTEGRIPFTVTFVPSPSCKKYMVTCINVPLLSVTVNTKGSGYNPSLPPSVTFSGGGGSGAAATANVGTGFIISSSLSSAGTGYIDGTYVGVPLTGGTGTGATATITVSGGIITLYSITNVGNGYINGDSLIPNAAAMGGSTPSVNAHISVNSDLGLVDSVTVNAVGSGYTSVPVVTIAPPPSGSTATATAVLDKCPAFTTTNCDGSIANIGRADLGKSGNLCSVTGGPNITPQFSSVPDGDCLCDCLLATFTVKGDSGSSTFGYTTCDGVYTLTTLTLRSSPSSFTVCVVNGSVGIANSGAAQGVVTYNGSC